MSNDCNKKTDSDSLEGHYANYFEVGHNAFEFVLNFGQFYQLNENNTPKRIHTKIITSPVYVKDLLETLSSSVKEYEKYFGAISEKYKDNGNE